MFTTFTVSCNCWFLKVLSSLQMIRNLFVIWSVGHLPKILSLKVIKLRLKVSLTIKMVAVKTLKYIIVTGTGSTLLISHHCITLVVK